MSDPRQFARRFRGDFAEIAGFSGVREGDLNRGEISPNLRTISASPEENAGSISADLRTFSAHPKTEREETEPPLYRGLLLRTDGPLDILNWGQFTHARVYVSRRLGPSTIKRVARASLGNYKCKRDGRLRVAMSTRVTRYLWPRLSPITAPLGWVARGAGVVPASAAPARSPAGSSSVFLAGACGDHFRSKRSEPPPHSSRRDGALLPPSYNSSLVLHV